MMMSVLWTMKDWTMLGSALPRVQTGQSGGGLKLLAIPLINAMSLILQIGVTGALEVRRGL